jgi:hypothetical protein
MNRIVKWTGADYRAKSHPMYAGNTYAWRVFASPLPKHWSLMWPYRPASSVQKNIQNKLLVAFFALILSNL